MKKKTVWIIVGIIAIWIGYRAYTNYQESLKYGRLTVSGENVTLSYDMISTYMERIEASEQFTLLEHTQDEQGDSLTIDYDASPYVTGEMTVYIPKDADAHVEPMRFYLSWDNFDYDDDVAYVEQMRERSKELWGTFFPIWGRMRKTISDGLFTPDMLFYVKCNTLEEGKMYTEDYLSKLSQLFAP